mgnify:CR=1 FL=1
MKIQTLDHIALIVKDIEASVKWYEDVIGLKKIYEGQWGGVPTFVVVKGTGTGLALFPATTDNPKAKPDGDYLVVDHFAFRVSGEDFEEAKKILPEKGIVIRIADHEIAKSIYMFDPDGYQVELTTYDV